MKLQTVLLLIILAAVTVFAAINWNVFTTPADLSFGVTHLQLPLGLIMLGTLVLVTIIFLVFAVYLQTSAFLATRRHLRELHAMKELADTAEASRFQQLRHDLESELQKQSNAHQQSMSDVLTRIDRLEGDLRVFIEQSDNTLAAYIGELDDRLEKSGIQSHTP